MNENMNAFDFCKIMGISAHAMLDDRSKYHKLFTSVGGEMVVTKENFDKFADHEMLTTELKMTAKRIADTIMEYFPRNGLAKLLAPHAKSSYSTLSKDSRKLWNVRDNAVATIKFLAPIAIQIETIKKA